MEQKGTQWYYRIDLKQMKRKYIFTYQTVNFLNLPPQEVTVYHQV